ncbi:MAG: pyridoxamine 5'-phosphate oxidase family protein [Janthinobacterium lividum]
MDSINKNQPEDNFENLAGSKAIEKLKDLSKDQTCFFVTNETNSQTGGVRPMGVLDVDDSGNIWFMSASDSHKNAAIAQDPSVKLFFKGSDHAEFLSLEGRATISTSKDDIKRLWSFMLKTWFTEGEDDPRITVIKVTPTDGYYWDNKHGSAVAGIKMFTGAVIGKTLDDSIEGRIAP